MSTISFSTALFLLSAILLLSATSTTAHNITLILEEHPSFSAFNSFLSQTKLADVINRRKTITVLAIDNDNVHALDGKPVDLLRRLLATHVILDYYDNLKLKKLKLATKTTVTTLFQASGTALDKQGFLGIVHKKDGTISFGSDVNGAPKDALFLGEIDTSPYNISVLSISHPIFAPGLDPSQPALPPPTPRNGSLAPPPSEEYVPAPEEPPTTTDPEPPTSDAPAPASEASPSPAADAPEGDTTPSDDDTPARPNNASGKGKQVFSFGFMVAILASFIAA